MRNLSCSQFRCFLCIECYRFAMIHASRQFILAVIIYASSVSGTTISEDLESVFLRLYIRTTMDEYIDYSLDNIGMLPTEMNNDRSTVLYIHGFSENLQKESVRTVVEAYLKRNDHNVIAVSYAEMANDSYTKVVRNAVYVGAAIAAALDKMVQAGFDPEKLHIIGHSMGSQVAGHIGRKVSFQVPRITGLDPAGPLFNIFEARLSSSDARFVDIIHTDFGFYGISRNTGTVDFFPNGGHRIQPGCPRNVTLYSKEDFCSHHRSWRFYAESLTSESTFVGVQCPSLSRFSSGDCNDNARVVMGYNTPSSANGSIYLVTATQSPYGLQEKGVQIIVA